MPSSGISSTSAPADKQPVAPENLPLMSLLIDGYNLLHASGILGRGVGPGGLERSRAALLNFLVESLDPADVQHTIVVFDAGSNSRGLPRSYEHRGLTVKFSIGHADADELIEQLIRLDSNPRRLTVVSSDHRLQRAAKRRKAHAIDSDKWFAVVLRGRIDRGRLDPPTAKPPGPLDENQVHFWLRQFGVEDTGVAEELDGQDPQAAGKYESEPPAPQDSPSDSAESSESSSNPGGPYNPFPPGYGEDVSEDDL